MTWKQPVLQSVLFLLLALALYRVECAAVRGDSAGERAVSHQAEQRQRMTEEKRRREYFEEQSNKIENYMEEERDEQNERSRNWAEQWREFNYDGLFPSYLNNRLYI
ncbi:hypothetical protein SKAU_G00041020 [Synaphobranchus kaupii]|uniref:Unique cartilage matrix-associated protein n=1 Tax=Synaphobranchus kaupii TaxID=118154 RepID=A0A9Q1G154_SYNKA|nr:hypothetical protein SKAU_G00041020 [Synaphobranchus kaupii]